MWIMRVIGFLYICAGLWCAAMPEIAAQSLSYRLDLESGLAEFFTVYGGLEVGIGLAMIVTTMHSSLLPGGMVFAAIFSWALAIFRVLSFVIFDPQSSVLIYLLLEMVLAVLLSFALLRTYRTFG